MCYLNNNKQKKTKQTIIKKKILSFQMLELLISMGSFAYALELNGIHINEHLVMFFLSLFFFFFFHKWNPGLSLLYLTFIIHESIV